MEIGAQKQRERLYQLFALPCNTMHYHAIPGGDKSTEEEIFMYFNFKQMHKFNALQT